MNAQSARVFAAAVQALAAVGKEVTFAVEGGALAVSAMPEAQAAFGQVRFAAQCFSKSKVRRVDARRLGCKVVARTLLPALRRATAKPSNRPGVSGVYKVLLRHDIQEDESDDEEDEEDDDEESDSEATPRLTIEIWHEDGAKRRWRLFYEAAECDFVPEFDERRVGEIVAQPLQFLGVFDRVLAGSDVDACVSAHDGVDVSSLDDDDNDKRAKTHLKIDKDDLDACDMPPDDGRGQVDAVRLNFHAKEVKAFVKFCEHAAVHHLRLRFSDPGRPIALDADTPSGAAIHFLVSTSAVVAGASSSKNFFSGGAIPSDPGASNDNRGRRPAQAPAAAKRPRYDDSDDDDDGA